MDEMFDTAIVGAGPAGISAACVLAGNGAKVVVLERGEYPGSKNMFGGVLYGRALEQIIPDYPQKELPHRTQYHRITHFLYLPGWGF